MILKSGTIIPFKFKDEKKLIAIPSSNNKNQLYFNDIKKAIHSEFPNLKTKCEFYNPKIGFRIPQELFIPYLEQRHDLTNFIVEIVESEEKCDHPITLESQKSTEIESKKPSKRDGNDVCPKQIKKLKLGSIDCDVEILLKTSTKGQAICNNFESSNQLSDEDRVSLIELIIHFEFKNILKSKAPIAIDTKKLISLSAAIVRRFPGEDPSKYFDEDLKSLKHIAGGKLYEQFIERKLQYIVQMERNDKYFDAPEGTIEADFPELEELREITGDWHTYFRAWQYTFDLRIAYFRNSLDPMGYFEKLISSVHDRTNDLVEYDFKRLHPTKNNNILDCWDQLSERIFTEALITGRNDVPLIMDLYGQNSELSGLMMLSYFVENYERDVKPFEKDDPENLVIHIESVDGDAEAFFKDYNDNYNLSTPLIFATGKTDEELNFYVLVGSHLFKMETVLKAVDFCFKCYQILQLSYPSEQCPSWYVIQNAFYDIHTDNDCTLSEKISKILKNL